MQWGRALELVSVKHAYNIHTIVNKYIEKHSIQLFIVKCIQRMCILP